MVSLAILVMFFELVETSEAVCLNVLVSVPSVTVELIVPVLESFTISRMVEPLVSVSLLRVAVFVDALNWVSLV